LLEKDADFKKIAERFKLPVHTTGEFTAAAPDPQLNVDPKLVAAAFHLSKDELNSDPIQVVDGFYILHLAGISEARPLTMEEAKPKIVEAIKSSRARELMSTKGAEIVQQLREAIKAGQPLDAAIQKTGVKVEKLEPFSLLDEATETKQEPPERSAVKNAVAYLKAGEISNFFPSGEIGLIAILENGQTSPDANNAAKKAAFKERILNNRRQIVFYEWLRDRQQAAGVQFAKG